MWLLLEQDPTPSELLQHHAALGCGCTHMVCVAAGFFNNNLKSPHVTKIYDTENSYLVAGAPVQGTVRSGRDHQ